MNIKTKMPTLAKLKRETYAIIEFRVGPDPRGPVKCIECEQAFKSGDRWRRMTAPPDPVFGTYSMGVHIKCPTQKSAQIA